MEKAVVELQGVVKYNKQHNGEKGGVNVYFVEVKETFESGKEYKHSFLVKQFFKANNKIKLLENETKVYITGDLRTESRTVNGEYETTTFISVSKPIAIL